MSPSAQSVHDPINRAAPHQEDQRDHDDDGHGRVIDASAAHGAGAAVRFEHSAPLTDSHRTIHEPAVASDTSDVA